jgi:hypothetical protein
MFGELYSIEMATLKPHCPAGWRAIFDDLANEKKGAIVLLQVGDPPRQ